jgi:RecB family exonuclease
VDRIDVDADGHALVRDYKGKTVYAGARWAQDGRLQAALYALAARELLGLEPAGALYQPIGRSDRRPRGLVRAGTPGRYVNVDVVEPEQLDAALGEVRELAVRTARALRAGDIRPCPSRCSPNGCAHPAICRAAEGAAEAGGVAPDGAAVPSAAAGAAAPGGAAGATTHGGARGGGS